MAQVRIPVDLVLLAQAGDRAALDALFRATQCWLFGYLLRLAGNRHLAEDVLQEVFVLIWRKLAFLRDPELYRPWAYRIATREAYRRLKKERAWSGLLTEEARLDTLATTDAGPPMSAEWLDRLPDHVAAVSPASRVVLVLHYLESLSLDETASVLGLSAGTVKSRLAYGLAALRRAFAADAAKELTHERPDSTR